MKKFNLIFIIAVAIGLAGCQSKVQYGDATEVETVNENFGSTDLQAITAKMVDSMLSFPPVVAMTAKDRPVIFVDKIKNKTSEHIDTESVTDSISNKLLRSGKFRFIDMTKVDTVRKQLDYQNNAGMVDPSTAINFGRQIGAQYMLYGNLSSIVKQDGSTKDVYYKMTMRLMDLETGLIEWSDEKEIRKTKSKSFLGM
ncbi:penicillin-binding protein activator LpoB [Shewanella loihica]|uniref:Penicillin-binding protein activator LpoB n=1 Tax=Shewanella loihica (strain ATCC BAA-1088 / PV-4) TaxID=323850 RepID=A3QB60_SHELP|nr:MULTISPECIES: penicillin-binding protein activator LpoB [Shewanella]ABO22708.1 membrane lipoprotein lipid attachment site [Shewanella loihica PV-4]QYJ83243.1 penicillin-binding protein activator LpoB [Shewanella aegiceratis]QYJ89241.1 penicillin-binding protein activator LpoB [Shewanella halotolerans]QYJ94609.1 penicillin-binding protein activator LpoB [Shewanella spartinae]QYJ98462.1 penicillin-binding protein activator LpoB [Shewanella alkalitolerans]